MEGIIFLSNYIDKDCFLLFFIFLYQETIAEIY